MERFVDFLLTESHWLAMALSLSVLAVSTLLLARARRRALGRGDLLAAMNLCYGTMLGVMGGGHLLAVTLELTRRELRTAPWMLYLLGFAIAVPATWLALRATRDAEPVLDRTSLRLNAWLGLCLLALGVHNAPLAAPAALNVAFGLNRRRPVAWTIGIALVAGYALLFAGSLVFFASGQSFEQFSGME